MFIAFPDTIKNLVTDVSPDFWRVQAAKFKFQSSSLLVINSYFPTDPQRDNANEAELLDTLNHIKNILSITEFDSVIWTGGINSDFRRNSSHTTTVQETLDEVGLLSAWDRFDIDFTATHELLGQTFTSILDHFFWSSNLNSSVVDAGVMYLPDNK